MELKMKVAIFYNDGTPTKVYEKSLWFISEYLFDKNVERVSVERYSFYTQKEFDGFCRGINYVRDLLSKFVNYME